MRKSNKRTIGFSTGCLFKTHSIKEAIPIIHETGCNAIELNLLRIEDFFRFLPGITKEDMESFGYMSMHAPKFRCYNNSQTADVFYDIAEFHSYCPLDVVVFHPNHVADFSVFAKARFPFAFENLDYREENGVYRTVEGMQTLFDEFPYTPMIFDVNHVYTMDESMAYAKKFYDAFGERIRHIHLSGCKDHYHYPLFETKQNAIIHAIQDKTTPIIIESILRADDLLKEIDYIKKELQ